MVVLEDEIGTPLRIPERCFRFGVDETPTDSVEDFFLIALRQTRDLPTDAGPLVKERLMLGHES